MKKLFLIPAVLASFASVASAQMFVNGGFDSGDLTGWTITNTTNGQSPFRIVEPFDIDGPGALGTNNAAKFSVGQVVFQSGVPAGIELTQNLNLTAGVTYTISFNWAAIRTITNNNAQGGIFDLIVNGASLVNGAAGGTSSTNPHFGFLTADFTPGASGAYTVGARITRPFTIPGVGGAEDLFQYVDNFSASAPVPEPGTMIVLVAGASAFLARRRKR